MASLGTAYIRIAPDMSGVQSKISKAFNLGGALKEAENQTNKFGKTSAAVMGAVAGVVSSIATKAFNMLSESIGGAIRRVDTLNNAPKVLQNLGFSAGDSREAIDKLAKGLKGLPTALDSAATSLVSIASATGYSIDKATDLTLAFNNMGLAGGKGTAEVDRAMVQFTQAMGRGKMGAQEFNTMMEVMPAQMNMVAKEILGADKNAQDLKEAFTNGVVSTDEFADAIMKLNTEGGDGFASFADQAKDSTDGIQTGFENMKTAITRGMADIIKSLGGDNITRTLSTIGSAFESVLKWVSEGLKIFKDMIAEVIKWLQPLLDYITQNEKVMQVLKTTLIVLAAVFAGAIIAAIVAVVAVVAALTAIIDILISTFTWVMQAAINAWNGIIGAWNGVVGFFNGVWNGIKNAFGNVGSFFRDKFTEGWNAIKNVFSLGGLMQIGKDIVAGIVKGLNPAPLVNKMKEIAKGAMDAVKSFFGIKSPSRVMRDQVGKQLIAGLGLGMEDEEATLINQARGISGNLLGAMNTNATFTSGLTSGTGRGGATIEQTNNVYTELDMNVVNRNLMWEFNRT